MCSSMANPTVIDLTIDESEEDSQSEVEKVQNACNYSDEEDLSTDEEAPNAYKKIKVESNRK